MSYMGKFLDKGKFLELLKEDRQKSFVIPQLILGGKLSPKTWPTAAVKTLVDTAVRQCSDTERGERKHLQRCNYCGAEVSKAKAYFFYPPYLSNVTDAKVYLKITEPSTYTGSPFSYRHTSLRYYACKGGVSLSLNTYLTIKKSVIQVWTFPLLSPVSTSCREGQGAKVPISGI